MDNSYARVELDADVHVGGTVGKPAVRGKLSAREDGEVYLRGNVFQISRGILEFNPDPPAVPLIDLQAQTRRAGYDITMRLGGRINDLHVILTSDPPLAQPDLMSLISTGSTSNSMSPGSAGPNSQDALVASISSDILGLAGRSLGLDMVRVGELDLDLLGDDVDPQTRLTIGKSIGSWLDLLLSQNLRESGLTWAVTVHPLGSVAVRFVSRDSQSNSLEVRHEIIFGQPGGRAPAPTKRRAERPRLTVASVTVSGGGLPEREVLDVTKTRTGKAFEFFEWQRDRERIERLFHGRGYLQVQVSATREPAPAGTSAVALRYQVRRGPITKLQITGYELPEPAVQGMMTAWTRSVDDRFLQEELRDLARAALIDHGYLWSEVGVDITSTTEPRVKTADVRITPGPRASLRRLAITGCRGLSERLLREMLAETGAGANGWRDPKALAASITDFYRRHGYLAATVSVAPPVLDGKMARLPIGIDEGPRHLVSKVDVAGAGTIPVAKVQQWLAWRVGAPFNPADRDAAVERIEAGFASDGYRAARAAVTAAAEPGTANIMVRVEVQPGVRSVVGEVQIVGRAVTRESIVRHALDLPVGAPLSTSAVDRAQRQLYETEAFRSVDITLQPMTERACFAGPLPSHPRRGLARGRAAVPRSLRRPADRRPEHRHADQRTAPRRLRRNPAPQPVRVGVQRRGRRPRGARQLQRPRPTEHPHVRALARPFLPVPEAGEVELRAGRVRTQRDLAHLPGAVAPRPEVRAVVRLFVHARGPAVRRRPGGGVGARQQHQSPTSSARSRGTHATARSMPRAGGSTRRASRSARRSSRPTSRTCATCSSRPRIARWARWCSPARRAPACWCT